MVTIFTGARLVDVGVDWLTVTASEVHECESLLSLGGSIISEKQECGYFSRREGFQGYTGYGAAGCFIGRRRDGVCLRVSGSTAHRRAVDIARIPVNISRIDLQLTAQLDGDQKDYAHEFVKAYRAEPRGTIGAHKRRTKLVDADTHGTTAYLGSRTASFYGRVYDKSRESNGEYPKGTWRAESECKRKLALPLFRQLAEYGFSREAIMALMVSQWYKRGVKLDFDVSLSIDEPVIPRERPDVQARIDWLTRVAQPVVRALHDAGYAGEAAHALYGWLAPEGEGGVLQ